MFFKILSSFSNDDTKVRGNDWLRKKVLPNRRIFRMNRNEVKFQRVKTQISRAFQLVKYKVVKADTGVIPPF